MDDRKRAAGFFQSGNLVYQTFPFTRQARILIVDALPPWWSATCTPLCDALDNFLSLASSLHGANRIPLLSVYAVSHQLKRLLPFVPVCGNLVRLHSCVEELRALPSEGCIRGAAKCGELLRRAMLDSLQEFKRYLRYTGNHANVSSSVEITVVTSHPGRGVLRQLELGLKGADLVSLKRLLVVQMYNSVEWALDTPSPEGSLTESEDLYMLGVEVDLQQVDNNAIAMETVLKEWLQEQGEDREQLHLILPSPGDSPVCVKCDMQERLISPTLILPTRNLGIMTGIMTKTPRHFQPANKGPANQNALPQRLKATKILHADGLSESVMYGRPLVVQPTTCWRLDWDEMENNHNLFNALCDTLRSRGLFLLLQSESSQRPTLGGPGDVYSHYVLQPSQSLSLLLKPVVSRELLLPCSVPDPIQEDPTPDAICAIQACLSQLEEEFVFNPLFLNSNLYQHLRSRGYLSQRQYPYELQSTAQKKPTLPLEGHKSTGNKQPRQTHRWPVGANGKVTVAPLPSSSSLSHLSTSSVGPPPAKAWRPALTLLSSGRSSNYRAPAQNISTDTSFGGLGREDENDGHAVTGP